MNRVAGFLFASSVLLGMAASADVHAGDGTYRSYQSAVGLCNGALPGFEGSLRKRPMGIRNIGDAPAFVSCAPAIGSIFTGSGSPRIWIGITNGSEQQIEISCTLALLVSTPSNPQFISKSITLDAGEYGELQFVAATDNNGVGFHLPGVSCALPPGGDLNFLVHDHYGN